MAQDGYGFNIELGLDSSKLNEGLKKVNKELKEEKAELTTINNQLKWDTDNIDAWRKKQKLLTSQIEKTKQKLALQNQQLKLASKEFDGTKESERKIKNLERAVAKTTNEIGKMGREIQNANDRMSSLTGLNIGTISKVGSNLSKYVTLPAIAAGTAIGGLGIKTAQSLDALADNASKVGMNVKTYQELIYATQILGGNTNSLQRAFIKVNAMLGDIADGKSLTIAQDLSRIGLTIDDIKGKNTTEVFMTLRKALASVKDESMRVNIANKIFGDRIGAEIMPLLMAEDKTLEQLTNEADRLGVATEEQIEISGKYTDSADRLKFALQGIAYKIMEALMPALTELNDKLTEELIPKVQDAIDKWNDLDEGTKNLVKSVGLLVVGLGPTLSMIGKVSLAAGGLHKAFLMVKTATGVLIGGLNPLIIALGAIAAALVYCYNTDEDFKNSVNELGKSVLELMKPIGELVTQLLEDLQPILDTLLNSVLKPLLDDVVLPIAQCLVDVLQPTLEALQPILNGLLEVLTPIIELVSDVLVGALETISEILKPILDIITEIMKKVTEVVSTITEGLGDKLGGLFGKIGKGVNKAVEGVKGAFGKVGDFFSGLFGGSDRKPEMPYLSPGVLNAPSSTSYSTNNTRNTTNSVVINTTSPTFDVDSINKALGGNFQ